MYNNNNCKYNLFLVKNLTFLSKKPCVCRIHTPIEQTVY